MSNLLAALSCESAVCIVEKRILPADLSVPSEAQSSKVEHLSMRARNRYIAAVTNRPPIDIPLGKNGM